MSTPQTASSPLATPRAWNLVRDGYVSDVVPQFVPFAADAIRLAGGVSGRRVVDVACGPGTLSLLAAADGAEVDALDFAPAMIEALEARRAAAGLSSVRACVGDGMALPYADTSFDAAFSMFGLIFFPDRGRGFAELRRVLRPGRPCVVGSWKPFDAVPVMAALMQALRAALPGLPFGQGVAPLGTREVFEHELREAGFREVVVHDVEHATTYPSVDAFWSSMQRSMAPLVLLRDSMGQDAFAAVAKSVRHDLGQAHGDGPIEAIFRANLGVGIAPTDAG